MLQRISLDQERLNRWDEKRLGILSSRNFSEAEWRKAFYDWEVSCKTGRQQEIVLSKTQKRVSSGKRKVKVR